MPARARLPGAELKNLTPTKKIIPKIPRRANRVFLHGDMPQLRVGDVGGIREVALQSLINSKGVMTSFSPHITRVGTLISEIPRLT